MFLEFWNANRPTDREFEHFRPETHRPAPFAADGLVQPYADSPVDRESVSQNTYLELINQARYSLFITTPYLILNNEIQTALTLAAKRGVDVRIYTPGIPDKKIAFQLTRSYFPPLLEGGGQDLQLHAGLSAQQDLAGGRPHCGGGVHQPGLPQPVPAF